MRAKFHKWQGEFYNWLAWQLPDRLLYFAAIRLWSWHTVKNEPDKCVSEVRLSDAIQALQNKLPEHRVRTDG
jgi:hypothetical protein